MSSRLNPYLTFNGNARQAMEFYASVFGGKLAVNTFAEFGTTDSPNADRIMHAVLETGAGYTIMAGDVASGVCCVAPTRGMLKARHTSGQIATASSARAIATRRFTGSSAASSS